MVRQETTELNNGRSNDWVIRSPLRAKKIMIGTFADAASTPGESNNDNSKKLHTSTASSSSTSPLKAIRRLVKFRRQATRTAATIMDAGELISAAAGDSSNEDCAVQLLLVCCPQDVVSKVLAFAGPQTVASLSQVNKEWKQVVDSVSKKIIIRPSREETTELKNGRSNDWTILSPLRAKKIVIGPFADAASTPDESNNDNSKKLHTSTALSSSTSPLKAIRRIVKFRRQATRTKATIMDAGELIATAAGDSSNENCAVQLLLVCCPQDVVSQVLAFAGPQTVASLSQVNKEWKQMIDREDTWRVLCEELHKWKSGQAIPNSWKEYYCQNPCVPVDFASISGALAGAARRHRHGHQSRKQPEQSNSKHGGTPRQRKQRRQHRSVRVLVRPGCYNLTEPVHIQTSSSSHKKKKNNNKNANMPVTITIEMMELPPSYVSDAVRNLALDDDEQPVEANSVILNSYSSAIIGSSNKNSNEPLFRVSHGTLILKHIRLRHESVGTDIWSGNAAIHVEPTKVSSDGVDSSLSSSTGSEGGHEQEPSNSRSNDQTASVILDHCEVTSASGRGIVVLSGGQLSMNGCAVHSCAATGIYLEDAQAGLEQTHVMSNGTGNRRDGGIGSGHSGIYLGQNGRVEITDSDISRNTSSGIGVASAEELINGRLTIANSDIVGNGSMPVELRGDSEAAILFLQHCASLHGNHIAMHGTSRQRSSLFHREVTVNAIPASLFHNVDIDSVLEFEEYFGG